MNFKPILFSTPMIQAILDGRKTQTRRIIKPQPSLMNDNNHFNWNGNYYLTRAELLDKCKVQKGDVFWGRENFCTPENWDHWPPSSLPEGVTINYKADLDNDDIDKLLHSGKWRPSIHMPKTACRIFLEVNDVRVERLQDISEDDAKAEGAIPSMPPERRPYYYPFYRIWAGIHGFDSWKENPWVWVYDFKRIEKPENFI